MYQSTQKYGKPCRKGTFKEQMSYSKLPLVHQILLGNLELNRRALKVHPYKRLLPHVDKRNNDLGTVSNQ